MTHSYDLTKLDEASFEHLANSLALRVLGAGHTGFGPGADGGRDGFFQGRAPYPSLTDQWDGTWYIQAKYHRPHLSADPQKWLLTQVKAEIAEFKKPHTRRVWPNNWIIVTNIDPSGVPETGSFDSTRNLVANARSSLKDHFHIWGGNKVLDLLSIHTELAEYYAHFLTPGTILSKLYAILGEDRAGIEEIIRYLSVTKFTEQQYTKLEQAGSAADTRPGIHHLFTDLPFTSEVQHASGMAAEQLCSSLAYNHIAVEPFAEGPNWHSWTHHPSRARTWFIKGGPGQGKSTLGQYIAQIQRAAIILSSDGPVVTQRQRLLANEVKHAAAALWPSAPRIPVTLELKEFAHWFGQRPANEPRGLLTYIADTIGAGLNQKVHPGTLKRAYSSARWLFIFDGLDEVPSDVKDGVASEVIFFIDDTLIGSNCECVCICTSRPQGYSGQFSRLDSTEVSLTPLSISQAIACAAPVLRVDRGDEEFANSIRILEDAAGSPAVREIMTTPLQAHIMAVVVRDGGRPPDRKWQLFDNFYRVIRKREANRNLKDPRLARLLREDERLIKSLHDRLGFELHFRSETSGGAQTSLARSELITIIREVVMSLQDALIDETVTILMEATTERLVLVNTPEAGDRVRFDIRPLQEFFAAEYFYNGATAAQLAQRVDVVVGDSHWSEVMHFLFSGLVESQRLTELTLLVVSLKQLDAVVLDGPDTTKPGPGLLNLRMARGAVIAARLFVEGVLDQDKRIRELFRDCLAPLMATTEVALVRPLFTVQRAHSRAWMLSHLREQLTSRAESEGVGAGLGLCRILMDDDDLRSVIASTLSCRSTPFLGCLLSLVEISLSEEDEELEDSAASNLMSSLAFGFLARDESRTAPDRDVASAFDILRRGYMHLPSLLEEFDVKECLRPVVPYILFGNTRQGASGDAPYLDIRGQQTRHDYSIGPVKVSRSTMLSDAQWSDWDEEILEGLDRLGGLFTVFASIVRLLNYPGQVSLDKLLTLTDGRVPSGLPAHWLSFLPVQVYSARYGFEPLVGDFSRLSWDTDAIGFSEDVMWTAPAQVDRDSWTDIVEKFPFVAMSLYASGAGQGAVVDFNSVVGNSTHYIDTFEAAEKLWERSLRHPKPLLGSPELWGKLIGALRTSVSPIDVRSALLDLIGDEPYDWTYGFYSRAIYPFRVYLPDEAAFLPYLANLSISAHWGFRTDTTEAEVVGCARTVFWSEGWSSRRGF